MSSPFDTENETPEYENLAKLAEDMVFRLPGCSDVMVRKAITSTYRDFCKRTCAIKTTRTITVESGTNRYFVAAKTTDCIVDCVTSVTANNRDVGNWAYRLDGNYITFCNRFLPNEDDTIDVEIECIEVPKIGSEVVKADFLNRYGDAIKNGALCQLFAMSGKPWSDANQAAFCGTEYENALTETRSRFHAGGNMVAGGLNFYKRGLVL